MDGLKISTGQGVNFNAAKATESKRGELQIDIPSDSGAPAKTFSSTLTDAINKVNELQKSSDSAMEKLATGQNTNIADVMIATEKADIAFKLMVQVRNKVIEAYQEIMKMQV